MTSLSLLLHFYIYILENQVAKMSGSESVGSEQARQRTGIGCKQEGRESTINPSLTPLFNPPSTSQRR